MTGEMDLRIVDFGDLDHGQLAEAARILREAVPSPTAYKAPGDSEAEVAKFQGASDRFGFAALVGDQVAGWIGGIRGYSHSLELHPLVVDPARQMRGVGRLLVAALETRARAEGFLAIHLGADDDFGGTNLAGRELFPNVLGHAEGIVAGARHPFGFYRKCGFEVVGLIPYGPRWPCRRPARAARGSTAPSARHPRARPERR
jgi:aminoglycoside 6'-N-acetyltransferase I